MLYLFPQQKFTMKENNNLGKSFIETIGSSELAKITHDIAEITIDKIILEKGIFQELPIVKTLFSIFKTTISIHNTLFLKKVFLFFSQLNNVSDDKRQEFLRKLDENENFRQKVGEKWAKIFY